MTVDRDQGGARQLVAGEGDKGSHQPESKHHTE